MTNPSGWRRSESATPMSTRRRVSSVWLPACAAYGRMSRALEEERGEGGREGERGDLADPAIPSVWYDVPSTDRLQRATCTETLMILAVPPEPSGIVNICRWKRAGWWWWWFVVVVVAMVGEQVVRTCEPRGWKSRLSWRTMSGKKSPGEALIGSGTHGLRCSQSRGGGGGGC